MRSPEEIQRRWTLTLQQTTSLESLKEHVKGPQATNPCTHGLRSVCWKICFLFRESKHTSWPLLLDDSRNAYTVLKDQFLKYIDRPDELNSTLDPLDEDQNSPWTTLRHDEELRSEIAQDVERCMPEEAFFRTSNIQQSLLNILFIFCKLNQDVGYRQGMHELLAPILWVVEGDAMDVVGNHDGARPPDFAGDDLMENVLNSGFIEHDAFTLFALLMQTGKSFYELGEPDKRSGSQASVGPSIKGVSPIVLRSRLIHEDYLAHVDPDLASHLTTIEILPQIFLIRWIRLLFGREFPFDKLLQLWDALFACDPVLDLVDLICVAMLLRIRPQLIEADYSTGLTILLKYPPLSDDETPSTFVDDAVLLRNDLSKSSGRRIIAKYNKTTLLAQDETEQPKTPSRKYSSSTEKRRAPLPSPSRFLQQQGGIEAILTGAAKGVLERGETLGINKAVRDAVGEVRKNMQGFAVSPQRSHSPRTSYSPRWSLDDGRIVHSKGAPAMVTASQARNEELASSLQAAIEKLRESQDMPDGSNRRQTIESAIAELDSIRSHLTGSPTATVSQRDVKTDSLLQPKDSQRTAVPEVRSTEPLTTSRDAHQKKHDVDARPAVIEFSRADTHANDPDDPAQTDSPASQRESAESIVEPRKPKNSARERRPDSLFPTRSTLAQSSFAWMLESSDSTQNEDPNERKSGPFLSSARKPTTGIRRERTAFLFGDDQEAPPQVPKKPGGERGDDMFTMNDMKRALNGETK